MQGSDVFGPLECNLVLPRITYFAAKWPYANLVHGKRSSGQSILVPYIYMTLTNMHASWWGDLVTQM
jgi:hypothetical protein